MLPRVTWHPILAAVETSPGRWLMRDPDGRDYGAIELRRIGPDTLRYRAEHRGELIGWAATLRTACERVHAAYIAAHGPGGGPVADWGELTGNARRR